MCTFACINEVFLEKKIEMDVVMLELNAALNQLRTQTKLI